MRKLDLDGKRVMLDERRFEMEQEDHQGNNVERRAFIGVLSALSESLIRKKYVYIFK